MAVDQEVAATSEKHDGLRAVPRATDRHGLRIVLGGPTNE